MSPNHQQFLHSILQLYLHIALGDWADAIIVAPATANTIAKLSVGIADDLVTSVASNVDVTKSSAIPTLNFAIVFAVAGATMIASGDINVASNRDTQIYCACHECAYV
jgi:phosphopantothenoylcysteine synthetase/decarboxylase